MPVTRKSAIITFVIITALWIVVILHGTLGFVAPDSKRGMAVDAVHSLVWLAFLYSGWRLYAALRQRQA